MKAWKLWSLATFLTMVVACCGTDDPVTPECGVGGENTCENGKECMPKAPGATEGTCEKIGAELLACMNGQIVCGAACCNSATELCGADTTCQPLPGPAPMPVIHSFAPASAGFGALLSIQGENFSTFPLSNSIVLGGFEVPASNIVVATETELVVEVPKNTLCTGPVRLCVGLVQVRVFGQTAASATPFTYVPTNTVSTVAGNGMLSYPGDYVDGPGVDAWFYGPANMVIDARGDLYVSDSFNHCIRKMTPEAEVSTFVGVCQTSGLREGSADVAQFYLPKGITVDTQGNFYVADTYNHRIRKVTPDGVVSTLAGSGLSGLNNGGFFDGPGNAARFHHPYGVAIDSENNLYVADTHNHCIRKVTPDGGVSTFAGTCETEGFGDGPASTAQFCYPRGLALDTLGNLYVADERNWRIRKVTPSGEVSTVAGIGIMDYVDGFRDVAQFYAPYDIAIDAANNLLVTDVAVNSIRKVTPEGFVSTLVGGRLGQGDGTGSQVGFYFPEGITIDAQGNFYVGDTHNHRIRKITIE
ncbi:MAG: IPT/TIG domain-containing protein [Cystobacterineae bacterium]|nr:IPT/TIG domain-containing protein [Cystobacterineae bacterium]